MNADIRNSLAFLLGLFIAGALLLPGASWATTVIPDVAGYTSSSAGYTPSAGQLQGWQGTYNSASKSYPVAGKINIMSKSIPVAGSAKLLDTAGDLAKAGMRLHPGKIVGTLAAGWLLDQGIGYLEGQGWMRDDPASGSTYPGSYGTGAAGCVAASSDPPPESQNEACNSGGLTNPAYHWARATSEYLDGFPEGCFVAAVTGWAYAARGYDCAAAAAPEKIRAPMTLDDWDALHDPTPTVGPELPNADYMPQGAPVSAPTYDFAPVSVPVGSPYKTPDGATHQDGVTLSPVINNITNNYNNVQVKNYSTKITNADGSPVPVPILEDKPDDVQDQCEKYPDSVGCAKLGEFEHPIPKKEVSFDFEPEAVSMAGQCPPDIQVLGSALSFAPACGAMSTIKPIVVGMAALVASMILFGGMRGAD